MAKEKLTEPMSSSKLVLFGRPPCLHQIAECLVRRVRHPDCGQLSGPIAASQISASSLSVLT